jgi:hypothetical protein
MHTCSMSTEHSQAPHGPDDFDRQLRDLTSGTAGEARFREPSAAERAAQAAGRPARRMSPRNIARARKLRKPPSESARGRGRPGSWRRTRLRVVGGRNARPAPGARRARLRSLAKGVGILAGFVALLVVMHLLGLGPQ